MPIFRDFWANSDIVPFLHSDTEYLHLDCVTIEKIWWRDPERARLILTGPMPDAALLFGLKDGDSILLLRKVCGPPHIFVADEVVMTCHDCRIRRKWLLNLCPNFSEQEILCIYVSLDCCLDIVSGQA